MKYKFSGNSSQRRKRNREVKILLKGALGSFLKDLSKEGIVYEERGLLKQITHGVRYGNRTIS